MTDSLLLPLLPPSLRLPPPLPALPLRPLSCFPPPLLAAVPRPRIRGPDDHASPRRQPSCARLVQDPLVVSQLALVSVSARQRGGREQRVRARPHYRRSNRAKRQRRHAFVAEELMARTGAG